MRNDHGSCVWKLMMVVGLATGLSVGASAQPADPAPSLDKPVEPPAQQPAQPAPEQPKDSFSAPKATPVKTEEPSATNTNQDPAAKEAFDQFADAMKALTSLTFEVTFSVDGNMKEMFGTAKAKIVAKRTDKGWSYRVTGKGKRTAKADDVEFDILYADGNASWLDKDTKKLLVRPAATARGKVLEAASNLRTLGDLFVASPLSKERAAGTMTLRDPEKAGETDCVVAVATVTTGGASSPAGDAAFWFGKDDHLPRKIVRERASTRGTTSMVLELTEIKKDVSVTAAELEIAMPEGYSKDDQTAAKASTPAAAPPAKVVAGEQDARLGVPTPFKVPDGGEPTLPGVEQPTRVEGENAATPSDAPQVGKDGVVTMPGVAPGTTTKTVPGLVPPPADSGPVQAFELKTVDGKTVTQETLRGKPAVVMFFGSWSLSSKKALPDFKALAEQYKDKAGVYAAAVRQRDPKAASKMVADAGLDVPVLVNADALAEQWQVGGYPAVYVLGADGEFLKKPSGGNVADMFTAARAALDAALGLTPPPAPAPSPQTEAAKSEEAGSEEASKNPDK